MNHTIFDFCTSSWMPGLLQGLTDIGEREEEYTDDSHDGEDNTLTPMKQGLQLHLPSLNIIAGMTESGQDKPIESIDQTQYQQRTSSPRTYRNKRRGIQQKTAIVLDDCIGSVEFQHSKLFDKLTTSSDTISSASSLSFKTSRSYLQLSRPLKKSLFKVISHLLISKQDLFYISLNQPFDRKYYPKRCTCGTDHN
ncbi:hypothetical protein PPL_06681 [Heterostelium album PN500]|uniref:Uncharacterized protein n=1 Tax=Heterostelium pallidum (strain ATCC 26659 / Pp 5 / PN500) TaxID=670386 RepID=D3BFE7_HETP5|nr:hypothetical protein PPL_06681 [Heterostelium album PN500]EFA79861.1 hypothetical protein PPL_06681 [Heterostelium album PN500]|eukprot:XP_020431982.1 hypothetical protein PPL_06681 [Heterostelium album PN500]